MKLVASPGSMHDTGCLGLVHWDDPEWWYGEGGGRREEGSGGGTHVYVWWIHFDIWQYQYSIVKLKNNNKKGGSCAWGLKHQLPSTDLCHPLVVMIMLNATMLLSNQPEVPSSHLPIMVNPVGHSKFPGREPFATETQFRTRAQNERF